MEEKSLLKKIFTLIGSFATHIISGSVLFYYTFIPYRYSYFKRGDLTLTSSSLSYIIPVSFMCMFGFSWFGAFLERKTNPRVALFVGNFFVLISFGLLYISKSVVVDYILFITYGIGIGINNLACMRCIFFRFPTLTKQGLRIGLSMSGYALAAGLSIMANIIINPEGAKPSINIDGKGDYIYPIFITNRMNKFIIIYICVLGLLSVISILSISNYETIVLEVDNRALLRKSNISSISAEDVGAPVKPVVTNEFKKIFKSLSFYFFIIIAILSTYGTFICLFTYYELGKLSFADPLMLTYCPFGFILCCGIGSLFWGIMYDKKRFKTNMYFILGVQIFLCIIFNFSVKWSWGFFVVLSLLGFTYGGVMAIFLAYMGQFYGEEYGMEVYGFICGGKAFSAIFSISMVSILGSADIPFVTGCLSMGIVGAVCNLVCILFIIFASDDLEIEKALPAITETE